MNNFNPIEELKKYISFPSVSTDPKYSEGLDNARDYLSGLLSEMNFEVKIIPTNCHPIIYAQRFGEINWPHIVLYAHYDVQPADPFDLWDTDPFNAIVKNGRIYGRGSADNKGPTMVHIAALKEIFKENPNLPLNFTYIIEGEEEIGSPSMTEFFDVYSDELSKADFMIVSDTASPNENQIVITTALRGLTELEFKVIGPDRDLHSGIHGGAVYNPLHAISEIVASLHKNDGSVNIPGFYENITNIEKWEQNELSKYPLSIEEYKSALKVNGFCNPRKKNPFEAVRFEPTLEINGLGGGYQGIGTKTIIPSEAFAKLTCRVVAGQNAKEIQNLVIDAIKNRCPKEVKLEINKGCAADAYLINPSSKNLNNDRLSKKIELFF